jgi:hypothetical protein
MKDKSRGVRLKRSAALKDLIVLVSIGIVLIAFASIFHLFERFAAFHQQYGVGPIDDFIIAFAVLTIAFAAFSLRRWRELQKALANIVTLQGLLPICGSCHKIRDEQAIGIGLSSTLKPVLRWSYSILFVLCA